MKYIGLKPLTLCITAIITVREIQLNLTDSPAAKPVFLLLLLSGAATALAFFVEPFGDPDDKGSSVKQSDDTPNPIASEFDRIRYEQKAAALAAQNKVHEQQSAALSHEADIARKKYEAARLDPLLAREAELRLAKIGNEIFDEQLKKVINQGALRLKISVYSYEQLIIRREQLRIELLRKRLLDKLARLDKKADLTIDIEIAEYAKEVEFELGKLGQDQSENREPHPQEEAQRHNPDSNGGASSS